MFPGPTPILELGPVLEGQTDVGSCGGFPASDVAAPLLELGGADGGGLVLRTWNYGLRLVGIGTLLVVGIDGGGYIVVRRTVRYGAVGVAGSGVQ